VYTVTMRSLGSRQAQQPASGPVTQQDGVLSTGKQSAAQGRSVTGSDNHYSPSPPTKRLKVLVSAAGLGAVAILSALAR
jgi:hypothetical protein